VQTSRPKKFWSPPALSGREWRDLERRFGVGQRDPRFRERVEELRRGFFRVGSKNVPRVRSAEVRRDLSKRHDAIRQLRIELQPKDERQRAVRTFADNAVRKVVRGANFGFVNLKLLELEQALRNALERIPQDRGGKARRSDRLVPVIEGLAQLWLERKGDWPRPPHWDEYISEYGRAEFMDVVIDLINRARPDHGFTRRTVAGKVQEVLRNLRGA
jgi:hypothetical protein